MLFESWQSDFNNVDQEELREIAHKTHVQEPAYIIEQWTKILNTARHSFQDLTKVYETLQPTVWKIVKSLTFPEEINVHQRAIQKHLTTYLKNADTQHLSLFLRSCTGSDIFLEKKIIIGFTQIQGFQMRPVALHVAVCWNCQSVMTATLTSAQRWTRC